MKLRSITTKLSVSAQITPTDLDAIAPPTEMDAAIDRVVERLTSAGAVSAIGNRRVFRVGQEPLDLFATVRVLRVNMSKAFLGRVLDNQARLTSELKPQYDFIVCGSGSSGSVVARRLAENSEVEVLLLEAGGNDDVPAVMEANQWLLNLGSERDWAFRAQANPHVNGRSIAFSMGKVVGGGSSINAMIWARGHKSDWDFFASEADDPAWNYASVLQIYRRIEDWHGAPDPKYRGARGPVFVEPAPTPNLLAPAMVEGRIRSEFQPSRIRMAA
jgi:hypothetical protein